MAFELKTLKDGKTPNPKYVDLLDEDPKIAGQHFGVFSFVTPGNILKKREMYLFEQFVKQWDWLKSMEKFGDFINFISYKYNLDPETLQKMYKDFLVEEKEALIKESKLEDDYKNFLDSQEDKLTETFSREHQFQTNVIGLKARGNFPTQEEAEEYAKKMRDRDPNHSTYVGPIGYWLPFDPNPDKTQRMEYMEEQLNQLHKEKLKNSEMAKQHFEERKREAKEKAIRENVEKAKKTGNKLTQHITESGELVGVQQTVDFEGREVSDPVEAEEILKKLTEEASKR